ncbi:PREDICTED: probable malate dehydrogenase, mitochondrial, partial [Ceratosolen solmsi marchali]|uniref:malate dehydrogenase n=1 Tax=Ceratosolen solmsi marchali TaxID=326594 RepID=A0AAJ6YT03_9HYME
MYSAILLKQNPAIKVIHVIDTDNSLTGPIYDIGQIDTSTVIMHYKRNSIINALHDIDIVALMDETHFSMGNKEPFYQFESSSNYVKNITECIINTCPKALIAVFTRPVTATLPLISEICKLSGTWNPNKIIGSASLESMRISAMEQQYMLINQLRSVDKYLYGSETKGPTLSSGLAAAKFISTLINGFKDQSISIGSAYVRSDIFPFCHYMTSQIQFGPNGIQRNFGFPKVSSSEILLIEEAAV